MIGLKDFLNRKGIIPKGRRTGKSLGIRLEIIGKCLQIPDVWFPVYDHMEEYAIRRHQFYNVLNLIKILKLQGFYCNKNNLQIMYSLKNLDKFKGMEVM